MLLAPGPIPAITATWYDQTVDNPGFADLEQSALADLPNLETLMDALIDPVAVIAAALPDDGLDPTLDGTDLILADLGGSDYAGAATVADSSLATLTEQIGNAYAVTPAEAFQVVPDPYAVPGVPPASTPANPATSVITDLNNPGSATIAVGDPFTIATTIPPSVGGSGNYANVDVVLYPWKNDEPQPQIDLGHTDQFGNLTYTGRFVEGDEGSWGGTIYTTTPAGTMIAGDTFYWTVVAAAAGSPPAPPGTSPEPPAKPKVPVPLPPQIVQRQPTVNFVNLTTGDGTHLKVGDRWALTITGDANVNVEIGGWQNAVQLTPVSLGQTDTAGVFTMSGQAGRGELGSWRETFQVGGVEWNGELDFIVTAN